MAISLIDAIRKGDEALAKRILQQRKYTTIDKQTSRNDGTALFWACCQGFFELVHLLILHGADVNSVTAWGSTPLHASSDNNHVEIVKLLIRLGANVNQKTKSGDTPCHLASYRGYATVVQILVESGADVDLSNNKHHTAMEEAISKGHCEIYYYLAAVHEYVKKCRKNGQQSLSSLPPHAKSLEPVYYNSTSPISNVTEPVWRENSSRFNKVPEKSAPCQGEFPSLSHNGLRDNRLSDNVYNNGLTDNGYKNFVGVLHVPNRSFYSSDRTLSLEGNDLSLKSEQNSVRTEMSFRNIP